ncbi:MAG: ECF transporter S component [Bacillota bacterium]
MHAVQTHSRIRTLLVTALMSALVAVLGLTPAGFVPVPTPAGAATTLHIPVILAALAEGPAAGATTGFLFGAFSFWRALTQAPNPIARMMFSDPLVAFGPRILIGLVAYAAFRAAGGRAGRWAVALLVAAALGDATYRLTSRVPTSVQAPYPGVTPVGLAAALAVAAATAWLALRLLGRQDVGPALAALLGSLTNTVGVLGLATWRAYLPWQVSLGIAVLHGLPEAFVATVLTVAVYRALRRAGLVRMAPAWPKRSERHAAGL